MWSLELDHLSLYLFISSQFKTLASLNNKHSLRYAFGLKTFKPQNNLLCSFSFPPTLENWLSLSITATLPPVITPLSLHIQRILAPLVLWYFVVLILATLLTESLMGFRNIHHVFESAIGRERKLYHSSFYPFICWWAPRLFPNSSYYRLCCYEHRDAYVLSDWCF